MGVKNLRRRLSAAEVHSLRKALLGLGPGQDLAPRDPEDTVVGYVCVGRVASGRAPRAEASGRGGGGLDETGSAPGIAVIAVADHVNLTWESPLTGPNDDRLGPRFPVAAGLYVPEVVTEAAAATGAGVATTPAAAATPPAVKTGIVAGVWDERGLSPFEAGVVADGGFSAVSGELASVAVVAAHLGYRVAAAVLVPAEAAIGPSAAAEAASGSAGRTVRAAGSETAGT